MKNDLYELTRKRRSVRRYGSAHIDDDTIHEIMKVPAIHFLKKFTGTVNGSDMKKIPPMSF